jgi:hypothetical protein
MLERGRGKGQLRRAARAEGSAPLAARRWPHAAGRTLHAAIRAQELP